MQAVKKPLPEPRRRVLVVDDNRDATRMLTILLRDMGFDVRTAATGTEGIEVGRAFVPDYALLDIVLPDIDGCELARDLRGLPGMDAAKIVAITAYDDDLARARAAEAGCNGYFLKPLSAQLLAQVLDAEHEVPPTASAAGDIGATVGLLDEAILGLENLMGESSAIGLDRARISTILQNCRRVRVRLAPRAMPSGTGGQPQFLDDEERAEVTAIVRDLEAGHAVRQAFEAGVDTRRLSRMTDLHLRERLQAAYTAAIRRFAERGTA